MLMYQALDTLFTCLPHVSCCRKVSLCWVSLMKEGHVRLKWKPVSISPLNKKENMVSEHFNSMTTCVLQNDEHSPAVYGTCFAYSLMSVMGSRVHILCFIVREITLLYNVQFSLMYHLENVYCSWI
jgi:hypothetical protein